MITDPANPRHGKVRRGDLDPTVGYQVLGEGLDKTQEELNLVFCSMDLLASDCHCEESDDEAISARRGFSLIEIASLRSQ